LIPFVGVKSYEPRLKPDYQYAYAAQFSQLYGLKDMYRRHPDKAWYYIAGCDTYINTDYALKMLSRYDDSKALWLHDGVIVEETLPKFLDTALERYPSWWGRASGKFHWGTGATGWWLSNKVMKDYSAALMDFMHRNKVYERTNEVEICFCPDKVSGLLIDPLT
jgi:hypothetical protein